MFLLSTLTEDNFERNQSEIRSVRLTKSSIHRAFPIPTDVLSTGSHLPAHASREVLVIMGALTTVDPGDINETLAACVRDRVRVSVVALAAEMKICRELCDKTGGASIML